MTVGTMGGVLLAVAVVLIVVAAVAMAATFLLVRRLRRPLLLFRGVTVPLRWRWSLARQATLHRRLMVAVGQVRIALPAGRDGPWQDLVADVEGLAAGVDRDLVGVDRQPRPLRQRALPGLEQRVREVETVAGRLLSGLGSWEAAGPGRTAAEITERLQAVEGALAELTDPARPDPVRADGGAGERGSRPPG